MISRRLLKDFDREIATVEQSVGQSCLSNLAFTAARILEFAAVRSSKSPLFAGALRFVNPRARRSFDVHYDRRLLLPIIIDDYPNVSRKGEEKRFSVAV